MVDSHQTAKSLLDKGRLAQRVTLIPLNKIRNTMMAQEKLEAAQEAVGGPELCKLALDLIDHDPEVHSM